MAEEILGKSVQQLKKERTIAKSSFTRQANFISRGASSMLQVELKEEFIKLSDCFRKMLDANEDYRIGLEADIKTEDEDAGLDVQQEADIDKSVKEGASTRAQARRSQQKVDPQAIQEIPKIETQEENPVVNPPLLRRKPTGWVKDLVEVRRFSSLSKLMAGCKWTVRTDNSRVRYMKDPTQMHASYISSVMTTSAVCVKESGQRERGGQNGQGVALYKTNELKLCHEEMDPVTKWKGVAQRFCERPRYLYSGPQTCRFTHVCSGRVDSDPENVRHVSLRRHCNSLYDKHNPKSTPEDSGSYLLFASFGDDMSLFSETMKVDQLKNSTSVVVKPNGVWNRFLINCVKIRRPHIVDWLLCRALWFSRHWSGALDGNIDATHTHTVVRTMLVKSG
ncbi:hypothetical protein JOB18_011231 [Solea senegalensis]|uniref:Uncharacterized protein n=1 Tax=Solea senegalensis TaxID=28829 RepID=A0AAV6QVC6_SOLSE|nr:hypothetical protein JOB18_011231 [Solea senegalensis]